MSTLTKQAGPVDDLFSPSSPMFIIFRALTGGKLPLQPGGNVTEQLRNITQSTLFREAVQSAEASGQSHYQALAYGMMRSLGMQNTPGNMQIANQAASLASKAESAIYPFAPGLFGPLHGVRGSPNELLRPLGEMYRTRENLPPAQVMSGAMATAAQNLHNKIHGGNDPEDIRGSTKGPASGAYGWSDGEVGGIMTMLNQRGLIQPPSLQALQSDPNALAQNVQPWLKPLAMAKQILAQQGIQADPNTCFQFIDQTGLFQNRQGPDQVASELGKKLFYQQGGGQFATAANRLGITFDPSRTGIGMNQLSQLHDELNQRGAQSKLGNLVGAAQRMAFDAPANSPINQWLQNVALKGKMNPFTNPSHLVQLGMASGFTPMQTYSYLQDPESNAGVLTTAHQLGIRSAQAAEFQARVSQMAYSMGRGRPTPGDYAAAQRQMASNWHVPQAAAPYLYNPQLLYKMQDIHNGEAGHFAQNFQAGIGWAPGDVLSRVMSHFQSVGEGKADPGILSAIQAAIPTVEWNKVAPLSQFTDAAKPGPLTTSTPAPPAPTPFRIPTPPLAFGLTKPAAAQENTGAIRAPVGFQRQSTNYSCGPTAVTAITKALAKTPTTEGEAMQHGHTTTEGTEPEGVVHDLELAGLKVTLRRPMSLPQLERELDKGNPVITPMQAWGDPKNYPSNGEGHYVTAVGYDGTNIYFEDPSLDGDYGYIPKAEFLKRWHDVTDTGEVLRQEGIIVQRPGKAPKPAEPDFKEKIAEEIASLPILLQGPKKNHMVSREMSQMARALSGALRIQRIAQRWQPKASKRRRKAG